MPNYKYVCNECNHSEMVSLPISTDPNKKLKCSKCTKRSFKRRICISEFPNRVGRVWAGDWFKKTYGHEIGERDKAYANEQAKLDREVEEVKKEYGINVGDVD